MNAGDGSLRASAVLSLIAVMTSGGCDGGSSRSFLSLGTAPVGGAFHAVGGDLCEVLNKNKGDNTWRAQPKGTKGSQENIRRLDQGDLQLALSNAAITYFAVLGRSGWEKKYEMRAVVTIAPNVAMFITKKDSGIERMTDLKGKRVVVGPSGAGFDMFVEPILEEHGLTFADFGAKLNNTQFGAVDMLADGNADAAFLGGAVPTASITQACSTHDIHFIPYEDDAMKRLVEKYPFFQPATIPADKYSDLESDYRGLNVGSMHLITAARQERDLIYRITKTIWENRVSITHPAGKFINEENAARFTGTEFHPGAIDFYKEIGIWREKVGPGGPPGQ